MRWLVLAMLLVLLARGGMSAHGQEGQDAQQLVDRLAAALSPQEKVGQLLMVEFTGIDTGPDSVLAALIRDYKIGAVYLNASNCNIVNGAGQDLPQCQGFGFPTDADPDTPGQVAGLNNALQTVACASTGVDVEGRAYCLPLFVSIDHEGDDRPLTRLRNRFTPMPSQMAIGATWDETQAEAVGCIVGKELAAVGVNMLLGPVADVLDKPRSGERGDMGVRVFGGNAAWVAELSRAYVRGVHDCGAGRVLTVTKHFPGHGGSTRDIEDEVASVSKSLSDLEALELVPFAEVARLDDEDPGGVTDAMMTAHLRYPPVQGSATAPPVSLDATALGAFMAVPEFAPWREDHLLMADALGVVALRRLEPAGVAFQHCEVAKKAIMAGNDLIPLAPWYSGDTDEGWERDQVPAIQATVDCLAQQYSLDQAFHQRVDAALARVIHTKLQLYPNLSLEEALVDEAAAAAKVGQERNAVYDLARDAITLVYPSQEELRVRLPRPPEAHERIVFVECWPDPRCSQSSINDSLEAMTLRLYGPDAGGRVSAANLSTITFGDLADLMDAKLEGDRAREIRQKLAAADWLIFAQADYNPNPSPIPASSALKRFLAPPWANLAASKKLVVIAFNSPYHLDATELSKVTAYFAVYSKSEPFREVALRAVFQDLTSFPGASPVDVDGAGYYLSYQLAPDPAVAMPLTVEAPEGGLTVGGTLRAQAGAIRDRNGNPVADGRSVEFRFEPMFGAATTVVAQTRGGSAEAEYQATVEGSLVITATSGGATSQARTVDVGGGSPPSTESPGVVSPSESGGGVPWALVIAPPAAIVAAAAVGAAALLYRRRRRVPAPLAAADAPPPPLRVDVNTRRVFLEGNELSLSGEQYRLLAFLNQNAGRTCTKDEVVSEVWPDMEASGVSEEAIDSLVHRVRERLRQAGATRQFIVTVRGQGYRLDLPGG